MEQSIQQFLGNVGTYGYFAVFVAMFLTGIGLPFPGEVTLGLTGYLVYSGQLNMISAISTATLGDLLGAAISYQLGFFGRSRIIVRYCSFLMPPEDKVKVIEEWLKKYGILAVVLGRIMPVIRGAVPISAGFVHMPGKAYMIGVSSSSVIWCGTLIYLGMGLGHNWQQIAAVSSSSGITAAGILLIAALAWYAVFLRKKLK